MDWDWGFTVDASKVVGLLLSTFLAYIYVKYKKKISEGWKTWKRVVGCLKLLPTMIDNVKSISAAMDTENELSLTNVVQRIRIDVEELAEQQAMLSATMLAHSDTGHTGKFHCDPDGKNIYVNYPYAKMLGVGRDELRGWNYANIVHPDDVDIVLKHWEECRTRHRQYRMAHRMVTHTNEIIYVHVVATPIPEGVVPPKMWVGTIRQYGEDEWFSVFTKTGAG